MKIRYCVKQLTDEGRLVDAPFSYETYEGFDPIGYDTEEEAEKEMEDFFNEKPKYDYIGIELVICKVYKED